MRAEGPPCPQRSGALFNTTLTRPVQRAITPPEPETNPRLGAAGGRGGLTNLARLVTPQPGAGPSAAASRERHVLSPGAVVGEITGRRACDARHTADAQEKQAQRVCAVCR